MLRPQTALAATSTTHLLYRLISSSSFFKNNIVSYRLIMASMQVLARANQHDESLSGSDSMFDFGKPWLINGKPESDGQGS